MLAAFLALALLLIVLGIIGAIKIATWLLVFIIVGALIVGLIASGRPRRRWTWTGGRRWTWGRRRTFD